MFWRDRGRATTMETRWCYTVVRSLVGQERQVDAWGGESRTAATCGTGDRCIEWPTRGSSLGGRGSGCFAGSIRIQKCWSGVGLEWDGLGRDGAMG